jgi:hypothetical protein
MLSTKVLVSHRSLSFKACTTTCCAKAVQARSVISKVVVDRRKTAVVVAVADLPVAVVVKGITKKLRRYLDVSYGRSTALFVAA